MPSTDRSKFKAAARRVARALFRIVRPVARPLAFRMRAYFSVVLQEEMRQSHQLTIEKLAQQSRQQQQLVERLFSKHTEEILRSLKKSSGAAASMPWTLTREGVQGAQGTTASVILKLLTPGDTFIDAGVGVGAHTLAVAQVLGTRGRIVCFDPFPPAREPVRLDDLLGDGVRADVLRIETGIAILPVLEGASGVLQSNPNIALVVERGPDMSDGRWLPSLARLGFEQVAIDAVAGEGAGLVLLARPGAPAWARLQGAL